MGMRTNVYGYIFADTAHDDRNWEVIKNYPYDTVYPFRPVFSMPSPGYQGSMTAFAAAIKASQEEWDEWRDAFERFLGKLNAFEARMSFEEAEAGGAAHYAYVITGKSQEGTVIVRWRIVAGQAQEETRITV
jgi:hypothetical protein